MTVQHMRSLLKIEGKSSFIHAVIWGAFWGCSSARLFMASF